MDFLWINGWLQRTTFWKHSLLMTTGITLNRRKKLFPTCKKPNVSKCQVLTQNTTGEVSDSRFLILLWTGAQADIVVSHDNDGLRTNFTSLLSENALFIQTDRQTDRVLHPGLFQLSFNAGGIDRNCTLLPPTHLLLWSGPTTKLLYYWIPSNIGHLLFHRCLTAFPHSLWVWCFGFQLQAVGAEIFTWKHLNCYLPRVSTLQFGHISWLMLPQLESPFHVEKPVLWTAETVLHVHPPALCGLCQKSSYQKDERSPLPYHYL